MSVSVFYAVQFSPAPKLGEWLSIAVIGENVEEKRAGVSFGDSLARIKRAYGNDVVQRVRYLQEDLSRLAKRLEKAHVEGQVSQPIPTVMADTGLSMSFSGEIVVFDGTFDESLEVLAASFVGC